MAERKPRRSSNFWAVNIMNPESPLLKALMREVQDGKERYKHQDGSVHKSRVIEELAIEGLRLRFQKRADKEGLALLDEYAFRQAAKAGTPLPTAPASIQPSTSPADAQQTAPTPVVKKRREGFFVINETGHMKESS